MGVQRAGIPLPADLRFNLGIFDDVGRSALRVRYTSFDALLATIGLGMILVLLILYLIYLLVRSMRGRKAQRELSKADRPLWILGLLVAASSWIFSTLLVTGTMWIEGEAWLACTLARFFGQYLFGWVLWTCLVLYKLIRKYIQVRMVGAKVPHALLTLTLLMLPVLLASILAGVRDRAGRDEEEVCIGMPVWLAILYTLLLLYFALFLALLIRIRRTIGLHHQIYRYAIFLSTSFVFLFFDALIQLSPLYVSMAAQQMITVLVLLIVVGNLGHIFALVFRTKPKIKTTMIDLDQQGPPPELSDSLTISSAEEGGSSPGGTAQRTDPHSDELLHRVNVMAAEGASIEGERLEDGMGPNGAGVDGQPIAEIGEDLHGLSLVLQKPRRNLSEEMLPDFEHFVDNLPENLASQIQRNAGYFAYRSRPKTRKVVEFDIDLARKYLTDDS